MARGKRTRNGPGTVRAAAAPGRPKAGWRLERLLAGLAAGAFGVFLWGRPTPDWWMGTALQAFSMWAVLGAFPRNAAAEPDRSSPAPAPRAGGVPILLGPLVPAVAAMVLFAIRQPVPGIVLSLVAGAVLLRARVPTDPDAVPGPGPAWEGKALAALLVLSAAMRLPFVGSSFTGFQIDEANNILSTLDVMEGRLTSPWAVGWWGTPSLPYFLVAGWFHVLGVSVPAARLFSAISSLVAVWLFFRLARRFLPFGAAWAASFLFTVSWWHLFYALSPFHNILNVVFELGALFFLDRALQEGRRSDYLWAGLFMAFSVDCYLPGRLVPAMGLAYVAGSALFRGWSFLRARLLHLFLTVYAFLWFIGPFLLFAARNPAEFLGRTKTLNIFSYVARTGDWTMPLKRLGTTLLGFFHTSAEVDARFGIPHVPMTDAVTGLLFLLGLFLALGTLKRRLTLLALPGLLLAMTANAFAIQGAEPKVDYLNGMRYFIALPFVLLLAGRGAAWAAGLLRGRRAWMVLLAAALLFGAGAWNARIFYFGFRSQSESWHPLGMGRQMILKHAFAAAPSSHVVLDEEICGPSVEVETFGRLAYAMHRRGQPLDLERSAQKDVLFYFFHWQTEDRWGPRRGMFPRAEIVTLNDPWGRPYLDVVRVPKDDWNARVKAADAPPLP